MTNYEYKLRDKFALAAMPAIVAKGHPWEAISGKNHKLISEAIARGAYAYADSMMAIREKLNG